MKSFYLAMLFAFFVVSAAAQTPDSLKIRYDSLLKAKTTRLDSTTDRINGKVDSLQMRLNNGLNPDLTKLSSRIKKPRTPQADSLKALQEYDSLKHGLTHKIDSLKGLRLPTDRYTRKLDSLNALGPQKYVDRAMSKKEALEQKINKPIDNIEGKVNEKLNTIKSEGGDVGNLNIGNASLDKANIPGIDTKINTDLNVDNPLTKIDNPIQNQTGQLNGIKEKASDLQSVPQQQIDKVKSIDQLQTAQEKVGDLNQATDKIQGYGDDVKNISQGNVGEVKQIPDALENKVKSLDEMKELEKGTGELAKAKEMANVGQDPEALKKMATDQGMKAAKDHFAGKEEVLQQAMDKLSKLKEKYSEVTSLTDITKRPPNPMKGKPLIERIVPGLTIQTLKWTYFSLDINPVVSYRFSGRINAGFGWNERFTFVEWNKLSGADRIYGPRVFGSFSFKKGFSAKFDVEKMNAMIPSTALTADAGSRQWVWSAFIGLKKDYKFVGKVTGNVQMLYNLYDDHDNSPYSDRFVVRMGFEFPMKKKKKPVAK